ncbi:hypothetical protein KKE85_01245 [Patescibacteria group bacterium]|nr:hypothetical protein [Patescibacteria group bacterium]
MPHPGHTHCPPGPSPNLSPEPSLATSCFNTGSGRGSGGVDGVAGGYCGEGGGVSGDSDPGIGTCTFSPFRPNNLFQKGIN